MSNQPKLWCVEVKKTIITHAIIELERVATVSTSFRLRQLMTHFVASDHELFGSRVSYSFGILAYNIYCSSEGISLVSKLVSEPLEVDDFSTTEEYVHTLNANESSSYR